MVLLAFSVTTVFSPVRTEHRHPLVISFLSIMPFPIFIFSVPLIRAPDTVCASVSPSPPIPFLTNFLSLDLCPNLSHSVSLIPN